MTDKDYSFIEESVRPRRQKNIKKYMKKLGAAASFGVAFGIVAAVSFYFTEKVLPQNSNQPVQKVSLVVATEEPQEEGKEAGTDNDSANGQKTEKGKDVPSDITEQPVETDVAMSTDNPKADTQTEQVMVTASPAAVNTLEKYAEMYRQIYDYCGEYYSTIITIAKTSNEKDYFENQIDLTSSFYGLILQKENDILYLLTDYDNIDGKSTYSLILEDGSNVDATLIGLDEIAGLAVMTADMTGIDKKVTDNLEIASIGSSIGIKTGELVVALGNPMGGIGSIGYGVVCSEPKTEYLTDRSVHIYNFGMQNVESGRGIVMNTKGNVVGIITHRFSSDMSLCSFMGISDLMITIEQIMNKHSRMGMGIIPRDVGADFFEDKNIKRGIYVSDMSSGSAAMAAGIMVGDIITAIDGKDINNVGDYMKIMAEYDTDDEVSVSIYREYAEKSETRELRVRLDELFG